MTAELWTHLEKLTELDAADIGYLVSDSSVHLRLIVCELLEQKSADSNPDRIA